MSTDALMDSEVVVDSAKQTELAERLKVKGLSETDKEFSDIRVADKEIEQIEREAAEVLKEIISFEITDETESLHVSQTLDKMLKHTEATRQQVVELNSNIGKKTYQGMENSNAKKAIDDLKEILIEFDPQKFKLNEPDRLLGLLPLPNSIAKKIRSYMNKFKEAESHIEDIVAGVVKAKEDSIQDLEDLSLFSLKLIKTAKELKKQYMRYQKIEEGLVKHIEELKEVDPLQARILEREVLSNVIQKRKDTLEVLGITRLGIVQTDVLITTEKSIINRLDRLSTSGRVIITIGQNIAMSLHRQEEAAKMIIGVEAALEQLLTGTAEDLNEHAKTMKALSEKGLSGSPDALAVAFKQAQEAIDLTNKTQEEMVRKARESIKQQEQLLGEIDKKAAETGNSNLLNGGGLNQDELAKMRAAAKAARSTPGTTPGTP